MNINHVFESICVGGTLRANEIHYNFNSKSCCKTLVIPNYFDNISSFRIVSNQVLVITNMNTEKPTCAYWDLKLNRNTSKTASK